MDYFTTSPNAVLKYFASDMILKIHSDAGYLNEGVPRPQSRRGPFLSWQQPKQTRNL
jgi:hypothetical protein